MFNKKRVNYVGIAVCIGFHISAKPTSVSQQFARLVCSISAMHGSIDSSRMSSNTACISSHGLRSGHVAPLA